MSMTCYYFDFVYYSNYIYLNYYRLCQSLGTIAFILPFCTTVKYLEVTINNGENNFLLTYIQVSEITIYLYRASCLHLVHL